jgi:hypothetical protein
LVGASIVASLANLGFDIYLHIKGCCGVYPSACRYRDEFDSLKKTLSTKSRNVDNIWTSGKKIIYKSIMEVRFAIDLTRSSLPSRFFGVAVP